MREDDSQLITEVAVIGMSGRFPGSEDLEAFWQHLRQGVCAIEFFSDRDQIEAGVDPDLMADSRFVPAGGVTGVEDQFDAEFFGCSPREAELMDPQQRWFLQCCWEALESAGYDPGRYPGLIGVYGGATTSSYQYGLYQSPELAGPASGLSVAMGNELCFLTTRVSHKLDLRGPSCPVQTACSTSLVAIHLACQSLLNGECDMAIAGAASIRVPLKRGYLYQEGGILSPDGSCRPFDASASGTLFTNGVGVVVLKRLQDALEDGDPIDAVIKGSAINNDGMHKASFTAPSVTGQGDVIASALAAADIDPGSIQFVEAHGTATRLGDSIEIQALKDAFAKRSVGDNLCGLGSVKANLGHLDAAAGVASFIKVVLSLREQELPPTPNFHQPNPDLELHHTPFRVQCELTPWQRQATPRRAGISSFGFGGTNAHVIVEEPPELPTGEAARRTQCLPLSAERSGALGEMSMRLAAHFTRHPDLSLADAAATLQSGRRMCRYRRAIVCASVADAIESLQGDSEQVVQGHVDGTSREVVLLLPDNSACPVFPRHLLEDEATLRNSLLQCNQIAADLSGDSTAGIRWEHGSESWKCADVFVDGRAGRFVFQWCLAELWISWGIRPAAIVAHGGGEWVAACLTGLLRPDEVIKCLLQADNRCRLQQDGLRLKLDGSRPGDAVAETLDSRWYSCAYQRWISNDTVPDPMHTDEFLRKFSTPCAVDRAVQVCSGRSESVFLELGQNSRLGEALRQQLGVANRDRLVSSWSADRHPPLLALGKLWVQGVSVEWSHLHRGERRRRVHLPTYPFARDRYWVGGHQDSAGDSRSQPDRSTDRLPDSGQWLYVPAWRRDQAAIVASDSDQVTRQRPVVMFMDRQGMGRRLADSMRKIGHVVVTVEAATRAEQFAELGDSHFQVNGASQDDFRQLLHRVAPDRHGLQVIYLWSVDDDDEHPDAINSSRPASACLSLLNLTRALAEISIDFQSTLCLLTGCLNDVTGDESLTACGGELVGMAKVIPQEYPQIACRVIDVDASTRHRLVDPDQDDSAFATDLLSNAGPAVVVYRHGRRWRQEFDRVVLAPQNTMLSRLTGNGFYWITGGLGEIGQAMARYFARSAQARLLLTSKSGVPAEDSWDTVLSNSAEDDATVQRIRFVQELRDLGSQVIVLAADASDSSEMSAALEQAETQWGRLNGIIHAAGLVRGNGFRPLRDVDRQTLELHFAAKIQGIQVIDRLLDKREPDFCLLVSSLSTILGGVRYGAYAAANSFMDTYAQMRNRDSTTDWISVNWDNWMNAADEQRQSQRGDEPQGYVLRPGEGIDVLKQVLYCDLGPQIVVSTGDLATRLSRWTTQANEATEKLAAPAVPRPLHRRPQLRVEFRPPQTELERSLAEIWQQLLGIAEVGVLDGFFELGGDSLLGIQMISKIHEEIGTFVSPVALYESPTIRDLAASIAASEDHRRQETTISYDRGKRRRQLQNTRSGGRSIPEE